MGLALSEEQTPHFVERQRTERIPRSQKKKLWAPPARRSALEDVLVKAAVTDSPEAHSWNRRHRPPFIRASSVKSIWVYQV